jgi:hypothetical protein
MAHLIECLCPETPPAIQVLHTELSGLLQRISIIFSSNPETELFATCACKSPYVLSFSILNRPLGRPPKRAHLIFYRGSVTTIHSTRRMQLSVGTSRNITMNCIWPWRRSKDGRSYYQGSLHGLAMRLLQHRVKNFDRVFPSVLHHPSLLTLLHTDTCLVSKHVYLRFREAFITGVHHRIGGASPLHGNLAKGSRLRKAAV